MKPTGLLLVLPLLAGIGAQAAEPPLSSSPEGKGFRSSEVSQPPLGRPGLAARYKLQTGAEGALSNSVAAFTLTLGSVAQQSEKSYQWLKLEATKANGHIFRVWMLTTGYPPSALTAARAMTARYLLQEADSKPVEFQDAFTRQAVLPSIGGWQELWPRSPEGQTLVQTNETFASEARYLGRQFALEGIEHTEPPLPPGDARLIKLHPSLMVGVPSNTRQKDEHRRYDNSDYELVRLTGADYAEMVQAGINCLKVDAEQVHWVQDLDAFYWGIGARELPYPDCLYRSTYLGSSLFLDEPAVGTRDYVIRPRLGKEPEFRKSITPQIAFEAFQRHFFEALKAASETDWGGLKFNQENLFTWETMVSSAAYQLSQDPLVPAAMVFEPPGRVGTLRTLPEMDMTYGCQLPVDDPRNFTDIIYGFLRGAARLTNKTWGTSIYGAVDGADAFWYLTHAYDLGATRFFFWDNAKIACVPYHECLALARNLRAHAQNYPVRDLQRLNHAAEVAILLPPGYNLGHVHLGKGSLWGLPELNLERLNRMGVKYLTVMSNFFIEIERCLKLGIAFDLLWDLPSLQLSGYREVVRVREDGDLEVDTGGIRQKLKAPRTPSRPSGTAPGLSVELSPPNGKAPIQVRARAQVRENSAPVYYTYGADNQGVYHNAMVSWEIFGPGDEDYRALQPEGLRPNVVQKGPVSEVTVSFRLSRAGRYRLRAATVDMAGRSTVCWTNLSVSQ